MAESTASTRRSLLLNSGFGVLAWFTPIILGFITTPLLVNGLGAELYGVYALILGFLSYSFTFGIGKVAGKYVAEFIAEGKDHLVSQAITATFLLSVIVGTIGAITLGAFTPWVAEQVFNLPAELRRPAETSLYIACITGLFAMISQVFQFTLQGVHRFGTYLLISNFGAVMLSGGNIALAVAGYGVTELIGWNLFTVATIGTIFYVSSVIAIPSFRFTLRIELPIVKAVAKYGANIIIFQIFANFLLLFERSLIVRRFGAESLTYYVVPMMIGIYLHGVVSSFGQVLFPNINELLNKPDELRSLYRKANRLIAVIVVFSVVTLVTLGGVLLELWVGPEFRVRSHTILVVHGLTFGLLGLIVVLMSVVESFRAAGLNAFSTFLFMVFGIVFMLYLAPAYGLLGIAEGRLFGIVATIPFLVYCERRFLGGEMLGFWFSIGLRLLPALLLLAIVQYLIVHFIPVSYFLVAITGMVSFGIYLAVLYFSAYFTSEEISRARIVFDRAFALLKLR